MSRVNIERLGFALWQATWVTDHHGRVSTQSRVTALTRRGVIRRAARVIRRNVRNRASIESIEVPE